MANICSNVMTISGAEKPRGALRKKIVEQDTELLKIFGWFAEEDYGRVNDLEDIKKETGDIVIDFTSKWSPPEKDLKVLSEAYPDLTFTVSYEEPGNDLYGKLVFKAGTVPEDTLMNLTEYLLENGTPEFTESAHDIKALAYRKFLKEVGDILDSDYGDPRENWIVEEMVLKRIKDKDLPLLINYEWSNEDAGNKFKERIKGGA